MLTVIGGWKWTKIMATSKSVMVILMKLMMVVIVIVMVMVMVIGDLKLTKITATSKKVIVMVIATVRHMKTGHLFTVIKSLRDNLILNDHFKNFHRMK